VITRILDAGASPLLAPDGAPLVNKTVEFVIVGIDGRPIDVWDALTGERIVGTVYAVTDANGILRSAAHPAQPLALWPNSRGDVATQYACRVHHPSVRDFRGNVPEGSTPLTWVEFMAGGTPLTPQQISVLDAHIGNAAVHLTPAEKTLLGQLAGTSQAAANTMQLTAAVSVGGHLVVTTDASGQAIPASNSVAAHALAIAGITTGAAVSGAPATVQFAGELTEPTWAWTPDLPLFLGANGLLTQAVPVAPAAFALVMGYAITSTKILLHPKTPLFIN